MIRTAKTRRSPPRGNLLSTEALGIYTGRGSPIGALCLDESGELLMDNPLCLAFIVCGCLSAQVAVAEDLFFNTAFFLGSGNCALCHDNLRSAAGEDVSIVRDWGGSMMAHSAKDPFWRAKVATELQRNPQLAPVINDRCTKCHAPMANYEIVREQGAEIDALGPYGILDPISPWHDAALNGVSCTLCHQIEDSPALGTLAGFSGEYPINPDRIIYGPFQNIFPQPMIMQTGYTPAYGPQISDSALCAACHNLKTPFVDEAGNILTDTPEAEFPEQMPYTEWENSIFADDGANPRSCQGCHMPSTSSVVANRPMWLRPKDGFAKHHFAGANTVMLTLLRDHAAELGVVAAPSQLALGIERAREMLQGAARVEILSTDLTGGILEARVKITNESGHKAPTAYPSRRIWVNFRVTDGEGRVVFESGRPTADGSIEGADNDLDPSAVEPHYERVSSPDQVQIYETIMGDSADDTTFTLLRAAQYLKDNRLPPKGFDKHRVPADVAVHGRAYDDPDFNLGSDEISYRVEAGDGGPLMVSVDLLYQPLAHGFVQDLYEDRQLPEVDAFRTLYEAQALKYEVIASDQMTVDGGVSGGGTVPTLSLTAEPERLQRGDRVTIRWSSADAQECRVSGDRNGIIPLSGMVSARLRAPVTLTVACRSAVGLVSESVVYETAGGGWLGLQ